MKRVFLLFLIISYAYSLDKSCIVSEEWNGKSKTETTSCLKGFSGVMAVSMFYQITIEGAGNATVDSSLYIDGESMYKAKPMIVQSFDHNGVASIGDGNALNPCKYPALQNIDASRLKNKLSLTKYETVDNAVVSYLVYNRLYDSKLELGETKTSVTPNFSTVAEYYLFNIEPSYNEKDNLYNITITLENNGPLHIDPFSSLAVTGLGNCVNTYQSAKGIGLDWNNEKVVNVSFLGRSGDWNVGLYTFALGTSYSIKVTKQYVGQIDGVVCEDYGYCEIPEEEEEEGQVTRHKVRRSKLPFITIPILGMIVIGAIYYIVYSNRRVNHVHYSEL